MSLKRKSKEFLRDTNGFRWEKTATKYHQHTAKEGTANRKYVSFDGCFEAVYSYDNELLNEETDSKRMGTYNYAPSTSGKRDAYIEHVMKDMAPYSRLGNVR